MWYNEIKDYDFRKPQFQSKIGHFSQVVWKGSEKIGIGVAAKDGRVFAVANYDPPGNFVGKLEENVQRAK